MSYRAICNGCRARLSRAFVLLYLVFGLVVCGAALAGAQPAYVGAERCGNCHQREFELWRGSHHDLAMAEATERSVLGDFDNAEFTAHGVTSRFYRSDGAFMVRTDGPDGKLQDYEVRYTFGWYPLQQYLIAFPGGRLQSLGIAWDARPRDQGGQRWFHLYPDEDMDHRHPLHWTGREQTWNYQCAECHSTNLAKHYDAATDRYATTWSEIDVACEACHGPGGEHVVWAETAGRDQAAEAGIGKGLVVDLADRDAGAWAVDAQSGKPRRSPARQDHTVIELCARCHSRRGQIWDHYVYGRPLHDTHRLSLLDEHLYFADGQIKDEVYVHGSFLQSRMYAAGVNCTDCHEPHSLKLHGEGNSVCTRCHTASRYDTPGHHHHAADSAAGACTACHMPQRTYMVIDERADHSLRVPRPDLSEALNTPNACNGCHADKSAAWAAKTLADWYPDSQHRGPQFGEALAAAQRNDADAAARVLALAADQDQPAIARATALDVAATRARPQHLMTVQRLLADDDALVRAAAVRWLENTDLRTRVDQAWTLLDDPARSVRLEAAHLLAPVSTQGVPDKLRSQLDGRIDEYIVAQKVNAERPEAHLNLGGMAAARGRMQEAEREYRTALRLDPSFTPAYANLADLYRQMDREAEGEEVLRRGIAQAPDSAALHYALGLLEVREQRMAEATASLRRATELAPDSGQYRYVYALALQRQGNLDQAIDALLEVLDRDAANRDARLALIGMYRERGDASAALREADELLRLDPDDAAAQELRAELERK